MCPFQHYYRVLMRVLILELPVPLMQSTTALHCTSGVDGSVVLSNRQRMSLNYLFGESPNEIRP